MVNLQVFSYFQIIVTTSIMFLSAQEVVDVPTQHGVIRGQVVSSPFGTEVEQFLGIPFAVPPIGSGRFGNPELYGEFPGGSLSLSSKIILEFCQIARNFLHFMILLYI